MRFIVDECCPRALVEALRASGFETFYVRDSMPGAADEVVAEFAAAESCIIVTQDYDFGELAVRGKLVPTGVILIEAASLLPLEQPQAVLGLVRELGDELIGTLVLLSELRHRVRRI